MPLGPLILALFIAIPIAEIWILIAVGGIIGVLPTVALVVLTALVGTALIRHQGLGLLHEARRKLDSGEPPVGAVVDGAFLLVAGALLLTPGFVTDTIGFLCLVPAFRRAAARWIWARYGDRIEVRHAGFGGRAGPREQPQRPGPIIEGEAKEVVVEDEPSGPARDDSPWNAPPPR